MDNTQKINRGINARLILDDPLVQEAFANLETMYIEDWKTSTVDDEVKRERAYMSLRALNDFKSALQSFVDTGKIAGKQVER